MVEKSCLTQETIRGYKQGELVEVYVTEVKTSWFHI